MLSYFDPYLSVDEVQEGPVVKIYPNPATDFLAIQTTHEIKLVEVFDFYGGKVLEQMQNHIDLRGIKPGIYFVVVSTSDGRVVKKVTIQ